MKCDKCGFENNCENKFCENCGNNLKTKNNIGVKCVKPKISKYNKYLGNVIVLLLFLVTLCLMFIYSFINAYTNASQCEPGGCSGFFLIFIPIIAFLCSIPLFVGLILSLIDLFIKKHIMKIKLIKDLM